MLLISEGTEEEKRKHQGGHLSKILKKKRHVKVNLMNVLVKMVAL